MVGGLVLSVVVVGGCAEWEVSWAAPWIAAAVRRSTGWSVEIGRVWVTPWRGLRAQDVKVQPAGGGRVHARALVVRYAPSDVWHGRVTSRWEAGPIHLDPRSWKLRRPKAVARLSEGPIVDTLHAVVTVGVQGVTVEQFRIRGWTMRGHGAGVWASGAARWWVRGQLATPVLEALGIHKTAGAWASFVYRVEGPVQHPAVAFRSKFLSLRMKPSGGVS